MDAITLLSTRASVRALIEPAPNQEELDRIFTMAMRAPDHGRLRPWRFIVIEGEDRIAFGQLLAQALQAREAQATPALLDKEKEKALQAPMIVAVAAVITDHPRISRLEQTMAAGAATQTLLLAFHALGYGAVWRTGEAAYDRLVKHGLGLAANDAIVGFISVGTPDPSRDTSERSPRPKAPDNVRRWKGSELENKK